MNDTPLTFIEDQFPVSLVSKESYKERKAVAGQTLTGLGKWWGRKPLILVRASILGLLMPASNDPKKDRDIFLKILTMDDDGMWQRRNKALPLALILEYAPTRALACIDHSGVRPAWMKGTTKADREALMRIVFDRLSYDDKLAYCARPEQVEGPSATAWKTINSHLGTSASSLQALMQQLGERRFGHTPKVGDAFCGGGSIPFEAARMGCEAFGSDLNPVATLLTWASIHLIGGGEAVQEEVQQAQEEAYEAADAQITAWGIEHHAKGWRADAYIYCVEARCPASDYMLPLAPSWVISEKYKVCAVLKPDHEAKRYDIKIVVDADPVTFAKARQGTVQSGRMVCPETGESFSITSIRGDRRVDGKTQYGLRLWDNDDLVPRPDDLFQERLYCVRWVENYWDDRTEREKTLRHYCSVDADDLAREVKVLALLQARFSDWQEKGYIPSRKIERGGDKTEEPIRTRGWTHWHHLFNPRQLLVTGLLASSFGGQSQKLISTQQLILGRLANWNSRNCRWLATQGGGIGGGKDTFDNQALNAMLNYSCRPLSALNSAQLNFNQFDIETKISVEVKDARQVSTINDIWITDPPYADAINYHELTDFFLAWYEKHIPKAFPEWYTDTKKALAVRGSGNDFKHAMVDVYTNLAKHMPNNGLQMVMFTHQDASVWADLAMILASAGLRVTAAWTIATETTSGLKKGNYVQGTVLLVLRKRLNEASAFLDEVYPEVEDEVKRQLDHMLALDDQEMPNFGDTDYQLAAYAAALKVITRYGEIDGRSIRYELFRHRDKKEPNEFEKVIDRAVEIASDHLVPKGLDRQHWRVLSAMERLYLKGLELENHQEARSGAYQELAKGFGVREYKELYAGTRANEVRFKSASEFKRSALGRGGFGDSLLRQMLFAIHETVKQDDAREGLNWLHTEVDDYWSKRKLIVALFHYLAAMAHAPHMPHWEVDADAALRLAGAVENDHG